MREPNTQSPVFTVSQLTQAIKLHLEQQFPTVGVKAEISNFKKQRSGHCYFTLKDSHAQISAVLFRADAAKLLRVPKDGDQVTAQGNLTLYPARGSYQIVVRSLCFSGVGELLLELEKRKREIHKRGWFKQEHKKPLPSLPQRIGIVTSPTGAAVQDILKVLSRRFSGCHIILNPVQVQGQAAAGEIAQAIQHFNAHKLADVLIVGRGGGSIEDLWAFNEEVVAKAIFESEIPILCAVGHEVDHCIAEYVADLRAPTPSAAAEIVIGEKEQMLQSLTLTQRRLQQSLRYLCKNARNRLHSLIKQPILSSPYALLAPYLQQCDDFRDNIDQQIQRTLKHQSLRLQSIQQRLHILNPISQLKQSQKRLVQISSNLDKLLHSRLRQSKSRLQIIQSLDLRIRDIVNLKRERLFGISNLLTQTNPKNILKKGYSILFSKKESSVIKTVQQIQSTPHIDIHLSDGIVGVKLDEVVRKEDVDSR